VYQVLGILNEVDSRKKLYEREGSNAKEQNGGGKRGKKSMNELPNSGPLVRNSASTLLGVMDAGDPSGHRFEGKPSLQ